MFEILIKIFIVYPKSQDLKKGLKIKYRVRWGIQPWFTAKFNYSKMNAGRILIFSGWMDSDGNKVCACAISNF